MPYQVTSIRDNYRYTAIVPRRELAYTIIKYLSELGLNLDEFKRVVEYGGLSAAHILSEPDYYAMVEQYPEMDLIYESIRLKNNQRMYFHTNWTVVYSKWQAITEVLHHYQIEVTTIKSNDRKYAKFKQPI